MRTHKQSAFASPDFKKKLKKIQENKPIKLKIEIRRRKRISFSGQIKVLNDSPAGCEVLELFIAFS